MEQNDYWFPEIESLGGGVLVMGFTLYPYVYMLVRSSLKNVSNSVTVALTLGFSTLRNLFSVVIPSVRPSIAAGLSLIMMELITYFGTPQFLAIDTFTIVIYRTWFLLQDKYSATILAIAELSFIIVLIVLEKRSAKKRYILLIYKYQFSLSQKTQYKWLYTVNLCLYRVYTTYTDRLYFSNDSVNILEHRKECVPL